MKSYTVHGLFNALELGTKKLGARSKPAAEGRAERRHLTSLYVKDASMILADYAKMETYFATCVASDQSLVERWLKSPKGDVVKVSPESNELHVASLYKYDRQFAASATARTIQKTIKGKRAFEVGVTYDMKNEVARAELASGDFMLIIRSPVAVKGVALFDNAREAFEQFDTAKAVICRAHIPVVGRTTEAGKYGIDGWRIHPNENIEVMYATFENEFALSEKGVRASSLVRVGLTKGRAPKPKEALKVIVIDRRFIAAIFHKGCTTPSFVASLDVADWADA